MGVSVRYVKSRAAWGVFVRDGEDDTRRSRFFGDGEVGKKKAERFAQIYAEEQGRSERWLTGPDLPCDEVLRGWLATQKPTLARSTEETVTGLINNHLVPFFGTRDLRTIEQLDLIEFADQKMKAGKSAAVCVNSLSLLRRVCELHCEAGLLTRNPAKGCKALVTRIAKRHSPPKRRTDSWSVEEAQALIAAGWEREPYVAPALEIAFSTGMRRGEILALTWEDIDFSRRRITVSKALVRGRIVPPKSGVVREIPIASALAKQLRSHRKSQRKSAPWSPEMVACPAPSGGLYDEHNFSRAWRRLRDKCDDARPLAFHCARHTFATLALEAGRSVKWLADVLGHADATVTLRTYAHALPADADGLDFVPLASKTTGTQSARNGTRSQSRRKKKNSSH